MLTLSENHSQKLGYFGFYCKAVIFTKFIVLTRVRLPSVNIIFCFFIIYFFFICKCFFLIVIPRASEIVITELLG